MIGEVPAGVPLIVPVTESIERPVGSVGWISHETTCAYVAERVF